MELPRRSRWIVDDLELALGSPPLALARRSWTIPSGEREKQARLGLDELEKRVPFEQGVENGHVVHHANVPENHILALDHAIEVAVVLEESDRFAKG